MHLVLVLHLHTATQWEYAFIQIGAGAIWFQVSQEYLSYLHFQPGNLFLLKPGIHWTQEMMLQIDNVKASTTLENSMTHHHFWKSKWNRDVVYCYSCFLLFKLFLLQINPVGTEVHQTEGQDCYEGPKPDLSSSNLMLQMCGRSWFLRQFS